MTALVCPPTTSGELIDLSRTARANSFCWPLAVSAALYRDVETVPRGCVGSETVSRRWNHVLLLATTPAAAQFLRDRRAGLRINVVLRMGTGHLTSNVSHNGLDGTGRGNWLP